ncbi:MAG: transglycosylase domain-containing protein, partial [candidate division WOR-3 bacterium]
MAAAAGRLFLRSLLAAACIITVLLVSVGSCYILLRRNLPTPETIVSFRAPAATRILDCQGRLIFEYFQERRRPVPLETIPPCLREAVIAVEDHRFYRHWGIDMLRLPGAMLGALRQGDVKGTSTITQQLARCMFLTPERSLIRKLREMVLAVELERHYSKPEILEMYFNQIWLGGPVYGVATAAERYFGKHVSRLDPVECATLGAMIANPSAYSPYRHPERLLRRRNFFLGKLRRLGLLTEGEYQAARQRPLEVMPQPGGQNEAPYFVEEVRRYLIERYGYDFVYRSGSVVHTTLDLDIQAAATSALLNWVDTLE